MTEAAPWLKAMENGALGEARARAFLMERFWVLERSVDVEGADYLVQRRLTRANFMDRDPPRLGVVQVKFVQDGNTYISVKKTYACDEDGHPYGEFFLLLFTGSEDDQKSYLLSGSELLKEATEKTEDGQSILRVKAAKILATSNYEMLTKRSALDRIERALSNADFMANRRFLSGFGHLKISADHIHEDYLLPLDNDWGDLRKTFFEEKKKVQRALFDVQDVVDAMRKILVSVDPLEAFDIYEQTISDHVERLDRISFKFDCFNDDDFVRTAVRHKAKLARLRELGIEGAYFSLQELFEKTIADKLSEKSFVEENQYARLKAEYDPVTLKDASITIAARATDEPTPFVSSSSKGKQIIYYDLWSHLSEPELSKIGDREGRRKTVMDRAWTFLRHFQAALDAEILGKEFVSD
jgi:hypothetical protein